ncbi:MAG: hypothetical protein CL731_07965 [Chloroflexi bacterium]|nr:hypothetical protein [Chloroflexota bacterium]MBO04932.1 hypothetical protein [Chloroflexota bacterium]HCI86988.1 hypothetical protein [Dehalococcoidia bacterium]|tara:strand:+ start:3052 stop:3381 length:330 start_codon:yes stop_codon:yes gene_type:complete
MGVVFVVLAVLALAIKLIGLLDREPAPVASPASAPANAPSATASPTVTPEGMTGEQIAAIAVALALSETKSAAMPARSSNVGSTTGSWLQAGRMRVLSSGSSSARERRG